MYSLLFSSLIGEPIAGAILHLSNDYKGLIVYAAVTVGVGTLVICGTKFALDRRVLARV